MILGALSTKVKLALVGILIVALVFFVWQWRSEIQNAARWAATGAQLEETIAEQEAELARVRAERDRIAGIADAREDEIRRARDREREALADLRGLEEEHEEVREWADTRLPGPLLDRLPRVAEGRPEGGGEDGDGLREAD